MLVLKNKKNMNAKYENGIQNEKVIYEIYGKKMKEQIITKSGNTKYYFHSNC